MNLRNLYVDSYLKLLYKQDIDWSYFYDSQILITGATGFLGGALVEAFSYMNEMEPSANIRVVASCRERKKLLDKFPHLRNQDFFAVVEGDVCDLRPHSCDPDFIFHAACKADPAAYIDSPVETLMTSALGTQRILECARSSGAKTVYLSSGVVYGDADTSVLDEAAFGSLDPLSPRSCYSEGKRFGEALCAGYIKEHLTDACIARISHTYGPGLSAGDSRVFSNFILQALTLNKIVISGDGLGSRPFCYVSDMISALLIIAIKGQTGEAYNVGQEVEMTILQLAELIKKIHNQKGFEIVVENRHRIGIRDSGHLDTGKVKSLGWFPRVPPEHGFEATYHYLKGEV